MFVQHNIHYLYKDALMTILLPSSHSNLLKPKPHKTQKVTTRIKIIIVVATQIMKLSVTRHDVSEVW